MKQDTVVLKLLVHTLKEESANTYCLTTYDTTFIIIQTYYVHNKKKVAEITWVRYIVESTLHKISHLT